MHVDLGLRGTARTSTHAVRLFSPSPVAAAFLLAARRQPRRCPRRCARHCRAAEEAGTQQAAARGLEWWRRVSNNTAGRTAPSPSAPPRARSGLQRAGRRSDARDRLPARAAAGAALLRVQQPLTALEAAAAAARRQHIPRKPQNPMKLLIRFVMKLKNQLIYLFRKSSKISFLESTLKREANL